MDATTALPVASNGGDRVGYSSSMDAMAVGGLRSAMNSSLDPGVDQLSKPELLEDISAGMIKINHYIFTTTM